MSKKIPNPKNQLFYTCGVEKSYVVQPKDKLDYERANKKPLEFMEKFDEREVIHKKVKQSARTGVYTYSEKTRSKKVNSVVSEKTRAVILKSKQ
jgi:hypothetical protein